VSKAVRVLLSVVTVVLNTVTNALEVTLEVPSVVLKTVLV